MPTSFILTEPRLTRPPPPPCLSEEPPTKIGSWWRGPYQVTQVLLQHGKSLSDKPRYIIRNLVRDTPLNIAVKKEPPTTYYLRV